MQVVDNSKHTVATERVAARLHDLIRCVHAKRGPSLHRRAVDVLTLVLQQLSAIGLQRAEETVRTSKAIQLMGSSCGISVFLTNSSFSVSVSKETVMMTPGLTHVPHIRWCFVILAVDV